MSTSSLLYLKPRFPIAPEQLLELSEHDRRLPIIGRNIPLRIEAREEFEEGRATFAAAAGGMAVRMDVEGGNQFGFATNRDISEVLGPLTGITDERIESQQTSGIVLQLSKGRHLWEARLTTPEPLTAEDIAMTHYGVGLLVMAFTSRLKGR